MSSPKKIKYQKHHKGRIKGISKKGWKISFGMFGLLALTGGYLTLKQIEAGRVALSKLIKKNGKIWIRIFPNKPITKKPAEVRMGKGKGPVHEWVAVIKPGRIIYEIDGISQNVAKKAMLIAKNKLPLSTKFISKDNLYI